MSDNSIHPVRDWKGGWLGDEKVIVKFQDELWIEDFNLILKNIFSLLNTFQYVVNQKL